MTMTPTRPRPDVEHRPDDIKMMDIADQWLIVGGLAAVIGFFLPWVEMTGFFNSSETGLGLAGTTESAASGMNLTILYVPLIAGIGILAMCLPKVRKTAGNWAYLGQIALAIVAVVPILLTVPDEISHWSGGDVGYSYGLWISVSGFAVAALAALGGALRRAEH